MEIGGVEIGGGGGGDRAGGDSETGRTSNAPEPPPERVCIKVGNHVAILLIH